MLQPPRSHQGQGRIFFAPRVCAERGSERACAGTSAGMATCPVGLCGKQLCCRLSSLSIRVHVAGRGQSFLMKKELSVSWEQLADWQGAGSNWQGEEHHGRGRFSGCDSTALLVLCVQGPEVTNTSPGLSEGQFVTEIYL